ncbi:unnamed protein product, partial [Meganyctiphanes norvegica]
MSLTRHELYKILLESKDQKRQNFCLTLLKKNIEKSTGCTFKENAYKRIFIALKRLNKSIKDGVKNNRDINWNEVLINDEDKEEVLPTPKIKTRKKSHILEIKPKQFNRTQNLFDGMVKKAKKEDVQPQQLCAGLLKRATWTTKSSVESPIQSSSTSTSKGIRVISDFSKKILYSENILQSNTCVSLETASTIIDDLELGKQKYVKLLRLLHSDMETHVLPNWEDISRYRVERIPPIIWEQPDGEYPAVIIDTKKAIIRTTEQILELPNVQSNVKKHCTSFTYNSRPQVNITVKYK